MLLACACGEPENFDNPVPPDGLPPDGTQLTDSGVDGGTDASITDAADATPPIITVTKPEAGDTLRGSIEVIVNVVDDSPPLTVTATISDLTIPLTSIGNDNFRGTVDTITLTGLVAPTIIVRAADNGGLTSEVGVQIVLDNQGPLASLDPPNLRLSRIQDGALECSVDFDPVGADAPNDGEVVAQLFELRGRVADTGNTGTLNSTLFIPRAGIRNVDLYVFDDTTKPLVVDSDGDGICDDINPDIVPATVPMTANEAAVITLTGIEPTGGAFFGSDTFGGFNSTCAAGDDTNVPAPLCLGENASVIIKDLDETPEIFGIAPVDDFNCMGFAFDARAANIADGFACAALLVTDNLGNRSVSEPLRICIDSNLSGGDCGGTALGGITAAGSRPNCTGTVSGGVVNNTVCTPRTFFEGSVANEFELVFE
jgi:hypothetical protein